MEMTHNDLKCFANDVLDLYCRTGISKIEDIFIKIANIDVAAFWHWLMRNGKVIKEDISDIRVYDALVLLGQIRNQFSYGEKIDRQTLVSTLYNFNAGSTIPVINTMADVIDELDVKQILQPYRDIIELSRSINKISPENQNLLISDLKIIRTLYIKTKVSGGIEEGKDKDKVKETIQQKRINMLQYLLNRFNEDIYNAANSSGMSELADAVKSGILAKPINSGLSDYISFDRLDASKVPVCKQWAEYILKKPHYEFQWGDHNHDVIEMVLMKEAGYLTKEDVLNVISDYEKKQDPLKSLEDPESMYPGLNASDKILDKRLNPNYLFLLSTFFVILRAKSGMPTGFAATTTY